MKLKPNDKQTKNIILFSLVTIILAILTILISTTSARLIKHSEKNTYEVRGIVTDFELVSPSYSGRKIRHPHIIHLDNGTDCVFDYYNSKCTTTIIIKRKSRMNLKANTLLFDCQK